ncbi:unnamed protein product [Effrenium voratum]|nr:unnamed protein product [Effrenium voratum]
MGLDFRLPVRGAVSGLAVDEEHQVLHVMFPEELQILDLRHQPGALLHRYRLPSFADPAKENPLRWSGIASAGHRLFAVTHSPAQLFCIQLPPLRPCGLRSCRL